MTARNRVTTAIALVLLATPASTLFSQSAPPSPQVQEWLGEMQQIQARLQPIEKQALEDRELREEQEGLSATIEQAMIDSDPTMEAKLERLRAIMAEAREAQGNGNQEKLAALVAEVQELHPQIAGAQLRALATPEIEARVAAFRGRLHARMAEIDPEVPSLIARFAALERQVRAATEGGG